MGRKSLFQTQGIWRPTNSPGANIEVAVFRERLDTPPSLSLVYLSGRDLSQQGYTLPGEGQYHHHHSVEGDGTASKPFVRLLDCLQQFPRSEFAAQILQPLLSSLRYSKTFRVEAGPNLTFSQTLDLTTIKLEAGGGEDGEDEGEGALEASEETAALGCDATLGNSLQRNSLDLHCDIELDETDCQEQTAQMFKVQSEEDVEEEEEKEKALLEFAQDHLELHTGYSDAGTDFASVGVDPHEQLLPGKRKRGRKHKLSRGVVKIGQTDSTHIAHLGEEGCVVEAEESVDGDPSWPRCQTCQTNFASPKQWKEHIRLGCDEANSNTRLFVCKKCKSRFSTPESLRDHVLSSHAELSLDQLICPTCGFMFKNEKGRMEHEKRIHHTTFSPTPRRKEKKDKKEKRDRSLPNGGAARVVCPTCGLECCTKWVLETHIKKFHENAFPQPRVCTLCYKPDTSNFSRRKYYTPYSLEKHRSEYHGEECHQIICEHCSQVFKGGVNQAKRSLRAHIDKVHLGIKHACDQCDKIFLTDKTLASHKRHVHRKEGKYPCKECGKVFGYYLQAVEHAYKDRGEAPHQCKFCDFKSAHSWALSKHRPVCKYKDLQEMSGGATSCQQQLQEF